MSCGLPGRAWQFKGRGGLTRWCRPAAAPPPGCAAAGCPGRTSPPAPAQTCGAACWPACQSGALQRSRRAGSAGGAAAGARSACSRRMPGALNTLALHPRQAAPTRVGGGAVKVHLANFGGGALGFGGGGGGVVSIGARRHACRLLGCGGGCPSEAARPGARGEAAQRGLCCCGRPGQLRRLQLRRCWLVGDAERSHGPQRREAPQHRLGRVWGLSCALGRLKPSGQVLQNRSARLQGPNKCAAGAARSGPHSGGGNAEQPASAALDRQTSTRLKCWMLGSTRVHACSCPGSR